MGDFTFDGQMLCARFDAAGRLAECFGAKTSRIVYQGRVLLDAVVRHKSDAVCGRKIN